MKEIELLENLTDMRLANEIMKSAKAGTDASINLLDRQYEGLGMQEMTPLEIVSQEYVQLRDYLKNSVVYIHNIAYRVHDIFRIERSGESDRFSTSMYAKIPNSDRRLLWHGSRSTKFGGILSQGLRIAPPEAPVSGTCSGKACIWRLSRQSLPTIPRPTSGNVGLLLLCEVELGKPSVKLTDADYNAGERAQEANRISTLGLDQTIPAGWKDAGCVHPALQGMSMPDTVTRRKRSDGAGMGLLYNEYIMYDVAQLRLRYLTRMDITGGY
jgi:poly [ADP-ribose] polymerase 2/3/4